MAIVGSFPGRLHKGQKIRNKSRFLSNPLIPPIISTCSTSDNQMFLPFEASMSSAVVILVLSAPLVKPGTTNPARPGEGEREGLRDLNHLLYINDQLGKGEVYKVKKTGCFFPKCTATHPQQVEEQLILVRSMHSHFYCLAIF